MRPGTHIRTDEIREKHREGLRRCFRKRKSGWKLTFQQIDEIKDLCGYMTNQELAEAYKVHHSLIGLIRKERIWAWL